MQLRKLLSCLLIGVVFVFVIVPSVHAQSTSITHLDAPSTAVVGESVTVRVGATYDLGSNGYAVSIGIFDLDAWWAYGTATSEENTCHIYASGQMAQQAFCGYIPSTRSGSDVIIFQLTFSTVKTYRLRASVELYDSHANLLSGVNTFQDFSITVQSASNTEAAYTPYTTPNAITSPSLQMPQPVVTSSSDNSALIGVGLLGVIGIVVAIIIYNEHRKSANTKPPRQEEVGIAEVAEPKPDKVIASTRFCIECGNELPPNLNFCDSCGTKQP